MIILLPSIVGNIYTCACAMNVSSPNIYKIHKDKYSGVDIAYLWLARFRNSLDEVFCAKAFKWRVVQAGRRWVGKGNGCQCSWVARS
jgi:hypothetical protein